MIKLIQKCYELQTIVQQQLSVESNSSTFPDGNVR